MVFLADIRADYFATWFLWPSIHDNFSSTDHIDDCVSDIVAVTEKSPLYKLITDDYGSSVFINPKTNKVERLSASNIDDFLEDSYGSYSRKIARKSTACLFWGGFDTDRSLDQSKYSFISCMHQIKIDRACRNRLYRTSQRGLKMRPGCLEQSCPRPSES